MGLGADSCVGLGADSVGLGADSVWVWMLTLCGF